MIELNSNLLCYVLLQRHKQTHNGNSSNNSYKRDVESVGELDVRHAESESGALSGKSVGMKSCSETERRAKGRRKERGILFRLHVRADAYLKAGLGAVALRRPPPSEPEQWARSPDEPHMLRDPWLSWSLPGSGLTRPSLSLPQPHPYPPLKHKDRKSKERLGAATKASVVPPPPPN